jgi:hypothetical protein
MQHCCTSQPSPYIYIVYIQSHTCIYQEAHVSAHILHGKIHSLCIYKPIIQVSISNRNISMGFCLFILLNKKYHVDWRYSLDKKNSYLILKCYRMYSPSFCCVLQRWTGKNAVFVYHTKRNVTWVAMITWRTTGKMLAACHRYWFMRYVCFETKDGVYGHKYTQINSGLNKLRHQCPYQSGLYYEYTGVPGSVILQSETPVSVKNPVKTSNSATRASYMSRSFTESRNNPWMRSTNLWDQNSLRMCSGSIGFRSYNNTVSGVDDDATTSSSGPVRSSSESNR